jgi:PAS domain S-box-containing protein
LTVHSQSASQDDDVQVFWISADGRILDVSEPVCAFLGYSRDELVALSIWDINRDFPAERWPEHWASLRAARRLRFQGRHWRRDGSAHEVEVITHYARIGGQEHNCAVVYPLTDGRRSYVALRESEARLALALDVSGQAMFELDLATGEAIHSEAHRAMVGRDESERIVPLDTWQGWIHPGDRDRIKHSFDECVAGKRTEAAVDFRLLHGAGHWIWVRSVARVVQWDEMGRPSRMLGTHLDISESKRAEEALQLTQVSIDRASIAVTWHDSDGKLIYINEEGCRSLGYSRDELMGCRVDKFDPDFRLDNFAEAWERLKAVGLHVFETRHMHKNGHCFHVEVTANYIPIGDKEFILSFSRDITERKATEQIIRSSEAFLDSIIEQSPMPLIIFDTMGRVVRYNHAALELFRATGAPEVINDYNLFKDDRVQNGGHLDLIQKVLSQGVTVRFQSRFELRKTGARSVLELDTTVFPIRNAEGAITHLAINHIDITDLKAAEAKLRYHLDSEQALADISALMIKPGWDDLDGRLDWMLARIGDLTRADRTFLFSVSADGRTATNTHEWCASGISPQIQDLQALPVADYAPFFGRLGHGQVIAVHANDLEYDLRFKPTLLEPGLHSLICIPVTAGNRLLGFLGLDALKRRRPWSEIDIRFLRLVAEIVAHTWQHLASYQALREHTRFLESLDRISRILTRSERDAIILADLTRELRDIFRADRAYLLHPCDPDAKTIEVTVESAQTEYSGVLPESRVIEPNETLRAVFRQALATKGPVLTGFEPESEDFQAYGTRSRMAIALRPQAQQPWQLGLHQCDAPRDWSESEQRLFQAIAERIEDALSGSLLRQQLTESESRYRAMFDNAMDGIIVNDAEGRILAVNETMLKMYGLEDGEASSYSIMDLSAPEHRAQDYRVLWNRLMGGGIDRSEWMARRPKDGSLFPVETLVRAIPFGDGQAILANVRDMTDRKRAEEALRQSEERFAKAFRSSPAAIAISSLTTGRIIDVNERWLDATGYRRDEVLDRTSAEIGLVQDEDARQRVQALFAETATLRDLPVRIRAKNGEIRDQLWSAERITLSGEPVLLSYIQDITERKRAEEALRQSEERFEKAFRSSPAPIAIASLGTGRLIDVNERWLDTTGFLREEVLDRTSVEIGLFPDEGERQRVAAALGSVNRVRDFPIQVRTKSGDLRDQLWSAETITLGGEPVLLSYVQDITESKRAEEALRQSEERFAKAFRANPAAMLISTMEDGRIIDANDRWLGLFGATREDLIGRTTGEVGVWRSAQDRTNAIEQLRRDGMVRDVPVVFYTSTGKPLDILWSAETISVGDEKVFLSSIHDLTEQKRAERAQRESEARLSAAIESIPFDFFLLDIDGRYVLQNSASRRRWGDVVGQHAAETTVHQGLDTRWEAKLNAVRAGEIADEELQVTANGDILFFRNVLAPVKDGESLRGIVELSMDITARKNTENELNTYRSHLEDLVSERTAALQQAMNQLMQAEKLASLGNLVAGLAHELNTPLGNARMVASTLGEHFMGLATAVEGGALRRSHLMEFLQTGRESVDLLERNTVRAADLISHVKEVAIDQTSVRRRVFNLLQTTEEVLSTMRPTLKRTDHRIEVDVPPDLEMDSFPGPLEQIITNLVSNSLTHGFAGKPSGVIRIEARALGQESILFSHADDGVGIPPDVQARVFDPFFTTRLGQGGSGLGLYIVYNLVTGALGGKIEVESGPGIQGTRFNLTLPRRAPERQSQDSSPP